MKYKNQILGLFSATVLMVGLVLQMVPTNSASAAQITNRKLTLEADTNPGSMPGGVVKHTFDYSLTGGTDIGSIKYEYCTTAAAVVNGLDCDMPTGLDTTTATLDAQTGATGFIGTDTTTNGTVIISRAAAAAASGAVHYELGNVTNPTTTNTTFFVRITTHASLDGSGAVVDSGTVTAATATQIVLDGIMPESLVFCTGETIGLTAGVPDCALATDGLIAFNQLFSPTDTATARSQMAASTNAGSGYVIAVHGPTLTSGGNTITAMGAIDTSKKGISQFGINLKDNTGLTSTPEIGTEVAQASNGTNYKGQAVGDYSTIDSFKFLTGETVANSAYDGTTNTTLGGTDAQIFTASYIVNVPGSQPAGTYTTTLTYICTPTF